MSVEGIVMANPVLGSPVTVNTAAVAVPPCKLAPPVIVRVLAVSKTTVPAVALAAIVPKSMSTDFAIEIGVTNTAVVLAVAVACAFTFVAKAIARIAIE
jgi:hypothetical protein